MEGWYKLEKNLSTTFDKITGEKMRHLKTAPFFSHFYFAFTAEGSDDVSKTQKINF